MIVNVRDFPSFAAALTAAPVGADVVCDRGAVYPVSARGTYSAASSVNKPLRLHGEGATLQLAADAPVGTRMLVVQDVEDVEIEDLRFSTVDGVKDITCLYLNGASGVTVRGGRFSNPRSGGVHIKSGVFDLTVDECRFVGAGYGILASDPDGGGDWAIRNSVFRGAMGGDGIELNCPTYGNVSGVIIAGNRVSGYRTAYQNGGFGVGVARCSNVSITGNIARDCSRNGFHVEDASRNVTVQANVAVDCGQAGIEVQGMRWAGHERFVDGITITGNTIDRCATDQTNGLGNGGIELGAGFKDVLGLTRGAVVQANVVTNCGAAGVHATRTDGVLTPNRCAGNVGPELVNR